MKCVASFKNSVDLDSWAPSLEEGVSLMAALNIPTCSKKGSQFGQLVQLFSEVDGHFGKDRLLSFSFSFTKIHFLNMCQKNWAAPPPFGQSRKNSFFFLRKPSLSLALVWWGNFGTLPGRETQWQEGLCVQGKKSEGGGRRTFFRNNLNFLVSTSWITRTRGWRELWGQSKPRDTFPHELSGSSSP